MSLLTIAPAYALPSGGEVVGGQASIATSGSQTTITQSTHRGIINWQSFDIGHGEHVLFQQPSASSVTLNRVTGGQGASQILGNLTANGTVMLVNPQGTFIGPNASINVGSFVATTSDIADDRFMAGDYRFDTPGEPNAAIINTGHITVAEGGLAAFVAPNVVNNGLIEARLGTVQLASGDRFTLDLYGDGLINLEASDAITSQLVSNSGIIAAQGGKVLIKAAAAQDVVNSLINMDGIISATSIGEQNGEIVIFAEGSNAVKDNDPSQKGQKQGSSNVLVSGIIDASGRKTGERGGNITVTGDNVALLAGTVIDASGHTGLSGTTAGKAVSAYRDGSAGGDIRIGGDYLGQGKTPTAQNLYVDPGALIVNDATYTGDAGRIIFWSDGTTQFYGNVYARALGGLGVNSITWGATEGGNPGDGGFVETSGKIHLDAGGYVDLTASSGEKGTYFLDPTDITIYGNVDPAFVSTDGTINLATSLKLWLDASDTSKVTLTYSTVGLSGATATGSSGSNTITTSVNVASNLAVGARIRLGSAGSVTTAATMGADTYTVASISGTTITLAENLTQNYTSSTLHRGLVSQLSDKSGQGNNATQATAANMPLWISNGQNVLGVARFDGNDSLRSAAGFGTNNSLSGNPAFTTSAVYMKASAANGNVFGWGDVWGALIAAGIYDNNSFSSYAFAGANGKQFQTTPLSQYVIRTGVKPAGPISSMDTRLNGASDASGVGDSGSTPSIAGGNPFYLGQWANYSSDGNLIGQSAETLVYTAALLTIPRNLVEQYQSAKWGIALTPPGAGATEVAKATAADGYSAFTTRYLERLSQSANVSLQATNNINLDFKGDTLNFTTSGRSLTLTAGNQITTASSGTITTNNGAITLNATNGIVLNHAYTLNSGGGNIALNNAVNGSGALTVNAGGGTITFAQPVGQTTSLGAVNLTAGSAMTLPTILASSITATTTSGNLTGAGGLVTSGGNITLSAANDLNLSAMGLVTGGGNVSLSAGQDLFLCTQINTGTGDLTASAGRDLFLTKNDLTTGLVGWWKFDEGSGTTAADSSASGNSGTLTNGPTYSTSTPFGSGYSLSFDGVNDVVAVTGNPYPNLSAAQPLTFSTWIYVTSVPANRNILSPIPYMVSGSYAPMLNIIGGKLMIDASNANVSNVRYTAPYNVPTNQWINVTGVWNPITQTASLYQNGALLGSVAYTSATNSANPINTSTWRIGSEYFNGTPNNFFNGLMDDVRIYNSALSAAEVGFLYKVPNAWQTGTTTLTAGRNAALDLKGDTLTLAAGKNLSVTAAGNLSAATSGTLTASQSAGAGGNVTLAATTGTLSSGSLTFNAGGDVSITSGGAMTLGTASGKTILARTTGATSDLTITSGKTLSASGTGNSLVLASGRNFINNAGSGALSAPNGRWLVYSADPAQNTLGGLSAGFSQYGTTYDANPPASIGNPGQNGLLYSLPSFIGFTATDSSRVYGAANPALGYQFFCSTGCLQGDAVTGQPGLSTGATSTTGVGTSAIIISMGDLALTGAYADYQIQLVDGTLTITQAPLTITANDLSKTYGDVVTFAGTEFAAAGLKNGETVGGVSLSSAGALASAGVAGSPYSIAVTNATGGTFSSSNYSITYNPGTLSVLPKSLVAGLQGTASKTYDGTTAASLDAGNYLLTGVIGGDSVHLNNPASGSYDNKHVGTGKLVSVNGLSLSGADSGNYQLASDSISGNIGAIGARTLLTSLVGTASKTYDGTTAASLDAGNYLLTGVIDGDSVNLNNPASGSYDNKHVGTGKSVSVNGLSLSGADSGNYQLASGSILGNIGTIVKRTLTALLVGTVGKMYDGDVFASLLPDNYSMSGKVSGDSLLLNSPSIGSYDNKHVSTGKSVLVTGLDLVGSDAGNYQLASGTINGSVGSITARPLNITGVTVDDKVYDGDVYAVLRSGGASLSGIVSGDVVSLESGAATGAFADKHVGTDKAVTATGYAVSGTDGGNYSLSQPVDLTASITAKTVTARLTGTVRKTYDGTNTAVFSGANFALPGLFSGDAVSIIHPNFGTYDNINAGLGKTVFVSGLSISGADAGNYLLSDASVSGPVGQIDASIEVQEISRISYFSIRGGSMAVSTPSAPVTLNSEPPPSTPSETFQRLSPAASTGKSPLPGSHVVIEVDPTLQWFYGLPSRL